MSKNFNIQFVYNNDGNCNWDTGRSTLRLFKKDVLRSAIIKSWTLGPETPRWVETKTSHFRRYPSCIYSYRHKVDINICDFKLKIHWKTTVYRKEKIVQNLVNFYIFVKCVRYIFVHRLTWMRYPTSNGWRRDLPS